jgi:glycosyltransferase involved in cell wall biosynthesis
MLRMAISNLTGGAVSAAGPGATARRTAGGSAQPAVSVLMSVRNGERHLDAALASLHAQTFGDFELVLVDNGSTDGTAAIIEDWCRRDPRIRAFKQAVPGLSNSLAFAARQARADLLARLDADDIAAPERLELQYAFMQRSPETGLLCTSIERMNEDGKTLNIHHVPEDDAALRHLFRTRNPIFHLTVMMRRDAYERAGGYREGLRAAEDYDLWTRMLEVTGIASIDRPLVRYRISPVGMTTRLSMRAHIVGYCVRAGQIGRPAGKPDAFIRGVPLLRRALATLGIDRRTLHYETFKMTVAAARKANQRGDVVSTRRLRRRARREALALPFRLAISKGVWRLLAMYPVYSWIHSHERRNPQR